MRFRRMIVMLAAVAGLSLGLPQAISAAYAAPAAPAAAHSAVSVQGPGTHRAIPRITWKRCEGQRTTWVSMDVITAAGLEDWCFAKGNGVPWIFSSPNNQVTNVCAGNNYGTFYFKHNGTPEHWDFAPGHVFHSYPPVTATKLVITGYSGADTCTS
jgi:hypothetical protein